MAEKEKNNRVKYKFGTNELDLKNYIHNIGTNVQAYLNSKNWNDQQKQEFMSAYNTILADFNDQLANNTNRFSTDDFGTISDTQGLLSNKDNDDIDPIGSEYYYDNKGNRITSDDYNLLKDNQKKKYKPFQANKAVATYFNIIGNALRQHTNNTSTTQTNKFDLSKHGFLASWNRENNPSGEGINYIPFMEMDEMNEDGTRQTSKRASYLKEQLTNYMNNLSNYDYEGSSFNDEATYKQRLQEAINGLENGYDSQDTIALNRAGITNEFLNSFFSNQETQPKTEIEQAQEIFKKQEEQKIQEQAKQIIENEENAKLQKEADAYFVDYLKNNPFQSKYYGLGEGTFNEDVLANSLRNKYNTEHLTDDMYNTYIQENIPKVLNYIKGNYTINPSFGMTVTEDDYNNYHKQQKQLLTNVLQAAIANGSLKETFQGSGEYIIPGSEDEYSFISYNPKTNSYEQKSMLLNEQLKKAMAYDQYKKIQSKEKGGTLKLQGGGLASRANQRYLEKKKQQQSQKVVQNKPSTTKDNDRTEEQKEAGQRKPGETGFTTLENARIVSAIMDIGSILAATLVPGYGTVGSAGLGLASTVTNLVTDINDDSMSGWDVVKNAGFGLAGDLAGLVPGIGALGKAGKIAKTLKYVAPTAIAAWGAYENGTAPIKALNKLLSDETLTVDDWKALSAGLQMLVGGARMAAGNKAVNKIKSNKEAVPYHTITTKSGNTYKVNPEDYKKITNASTIEDQNKALREAIKNDSEELGSKFKTSKREKLRHPFTPEPKTGKGIEYKDKNIDYTKQERIPWQYKVDVNTNTVKPRVLSDEWILQRTGNLTFRDPNFNLFTRKNPLYTNSQNISVNTQAPKNTSILGSGPSINQLRIWSKTPSWALKRGYGKDFGIREPQKTKKEIELGIEFDKKGGTLNLANVRKFQNGKTITNTTSKANWFSDMFSSDAMQKWIDSYTLDNYQKFNDLQKSWSNNKKATQYVPGAIPLAWNQGVQDRQKLWNDTGTNSVIEDLVTKGIITRSGNSGDNATGGYTDGYFGEQEFLRHGGTEDSWKGHEAELAKFQNMLKEKGLQYTLDPKTGMYLMFPIQNVEQDTKQKSGTSLLNTEDTGDNQFNDQKNSPRDYLNDVINRMVSNPTITYGIPRAFYADKMNRKITDLGKEEPLQRNPIERTRYVMSDLDAEMQGAQNYARLRNLASIPFTADADKQKAYQFEAEIKGQDALNQGKMQSNKVRKYYEELALQQEKENDLSRHETAIYNDYQRWLTNQTNNKLEQAYLAKKHNIWDTLWQQFEFDQRKDLQKKEDLYDRFNRSDIHNAVIYNPNDYGANLTNEELQVWNYVLTGVQPSSLGDKFNLYLTAQKKVSEAEQNQLKQYYNIPESIWSNARQYYEPENSFTPKVTFEAKKGGKLKSDLEDIRNFQKQIKEGIKRNDKAIERLFKYVNKRK